MDLKGQFKIIKSIGKGTYGTVFLCEDEESGALKILKEIHINAKEKEKAALGAENEVKILSKLRHPNIIEYYHSYCEGSHVFILMEYASQGNLAQYMFKRKLQFLPEQEILFFLSQILLGVKYIHSKNIIHRDLKAENILLTGKNGVIVKIGDFGIARTLLSDQKAQTVIGTPYYLAPELCDGKPYDTKTDVWALGCLLFEMCTHQRAFESETLSGLIKEILLGSVKPISSAHYSRGMQDLIDCMLSVTPEKRPTIQDVINKKIVTPITFAVYIDAGCDDLLEELFNSLMKTDLIKS